MSMALSVPLILLLLSLIQRSVYGEIGSEGGQKLSPGTVAFRNAKLKSIWAKLEKKIPPAEHNGVVEELRYLDKQLMSDKHSGSGYTADQFDQSLRSILRRYHLETLLPADTKPPQPREFDDFRLDRLWNQLLAMGPPKEILKEFRVEFSSIQDRIGDYEASLRQQTVDPSDEESSDPKRPEHLLQLKTIRMQIDQDIAALRQKISFKSPDRVDPDMKFRSPKANQLWRSAMGNLMPADDLKSIRDDIKLLDQKVDKLLFYQNELSSFKANAKYEERKETERKVKDLERQVEKLEKFIASKISSHHNEL